MKSKRSICILLCLSLLLVTFTGCASRNDNPFHDDDPAQTPPGSSGAAPGDHDHGDDCDHPLGIDFEAAISAFPPDTVMFSSAAGTITWAELFVFLFRTVSNIYYSYGGEFDWSDEFYGDISLSRFVLEYSTDEASSFLAFAYGIDANNFSLSNDLLSEFTNDLNELIDAYGGREELTLSLRENAGFYSLEVFEKLYKLEYTAHHLLNYLYGEEFSSFPDELVAKYAEENGYMMAMHILRLKIDGDDTPLAESEEILAELNNHRDSDDLHDVFFDLMNLHSEDGGLASSPNGYLFQFSDMVEPFSAAAASLEIGQMSDIVETVYGYHIILKIPIDYDAIPTGFAWEGIHQTLRQAAAYADFDKQMLSWLDSLKITFTAEFDSIDLAAIFKFC